jgi:hypothetical protein
MKTSPYGLNSKTAKTSLRWLPLGTWISKFWVRGASSWLKRLREPKFQLSRSYGLGCRRGTNFAYGNGDGNGNGNGNGNGAWQTEIFLLLKSSFLAIKSPKTWKSAIKIFHFSHHETNTSLIFHMWQVKIETLYMRCFSIALNEPAFDEPNQFKNCAFCIFILKKITCDWVRNHAFDQFWNKNLVNSLLLKNCLDRF